jgi:Tetratricopeptide repeat
VPGRDTTGRVASRAICRPLASTDAGDWTRHGRERRPLLARAGGRFGPARPEAFTPNLATSLNTLANSLLELGRREEALKAAEEAADLYRALTAARPEA